jgi:hypothetical protein
MPSLRDPALDERFDELAAQIRGARPRAGIELRDHVRETAARGVPLAEPRRRFRLAPILVIAALALAAVGLGLGLALRSDGVGGGSREGSAAATAPSGEAFRAAGGGEAADSAAPPSTALEAQKSAAALPPSATRLQLYRAEMTIRVGSVRELNAATRRAIRIARSLGGFVVSADLRTPEQAEGTSRLVVRVPTTKAQAAFERFAGLGTLVAQRVRLDDLQTGVNRRNEHIEDLQAQIAALEKRDAAGEDVDDALRALRAELRRQQEAIEAATRRGRLATFSLALTTADASAAPEPDGEIEHAVREAWGLLDDLVAAALYALILGGPIVVLGILVWLLERRRRRRSDDRLLEQTG